MRSNRRPHERRLNAIAVGLTILGVAKVIGLLSGIWPLEWLGIISGISPSPSPYREVYNENYGDPRFGSLIGCEAANGDIKWSKWEHPLRSRVPGPHRRIVSMLAYFEAVRYSGTPEQEERRTILSKYYFCNNGPLAQAAECAPDLKSVMFKLNLPVPVKGVSFLRYPCTK